MRLITKIKDLVMGILDKQKTKNKHIKNKPSSNTNHLTNLTTSEVKYLLQLISKSEFKGADLQMIFTITAKLQNQITKSE
jgi:hypothetical protein